MVFSYNIKKKFRPARARGCTMHGKKHNFVKLYVALD
jgi:hypothetical protein